MSLRNVGIVYRKELIDSLRDRRTVLSMVAVPLLLMPLLTIGIEVIRETLPLIRRRGCTNTNSGRLSAE